VVLDARIDAIKASAQQSTSSEAAYTLEQADTAKLECLRNGQRIFYAQIGAFISAPDYNTLLDRTLVAGDTLLKTNCLSFIRPEDDLVSQDSFVRALPFVYDFRHDRKSALRARMTYLSQLSSVLPFFGSGRGSDNLCYLGYKRSGEPFMCNPFLKSDRSRVAHQMVFGPTGAGKSATMISMALMSMAVNAPRQFVLDKGNSFGLLADYYEDMNRWAFNLQIYFLNKRFRDVVEISRSSDTVIQDRTIFEDARIFAPNLHDMGLMSDRDFENYTHLFDLMLSLVKLPDLLIYIRSSVPHLIDHIQQRGRDYEQTMRIDYLRGLNERYENWIKTYEGELMIVDGDSTDFAGNPQDFKRIEDMIDARLFGLFPPK